MASINIVPVGCKLSYCTYVVDTSYSFIQDTPRRNSISADSLAHSVVGPSFINGQNKSMIGFEPHQSLFSIVPGEGGGGQNHDTTPLDQRGGNGVYPLRLRTLRMSCASRGHFATPYQPVEECIEPVGETHSLTGNVRHGHVGGRDGPAIAHTLEQGQPPFLRPRGPGAGVRRKS